jgi:hypothetical protein
VVAQQIVGKARGEEGSKKVGKVQNCWNLVEVIVWSRSISTVQGKDAIE